MNKLIFVIIIFFVISTAIVAENQTAVELTVLNNFVRMNDDSWLYLNSGVAGISFISTGNRNVKGELAFTLGNEPKTIYGMGTVMDDTTIVASALNLDLLIEKLYVKFRLPGFRTTLGKTRISWGEGNAFNAGDVLFGSEDVNIDLTASVLRNQTRWLTSIFIPFGNFVFIEALAMAPPLTGTMELSESSVGVRFYATPGKWKTEAGYLYSGENDESHKPYISLKYNIEADIYVSSSAVIPKNGGEFEEWNETWKISGGLFYMVDMPSDHTLTLRAEGIFSPYGRWDNEESFRTVYNSVSGQVLAAGETPGVVLYPEIVWSTGSTGFSLGLSSLISPLDASLRGAVFASWGVYQGFTLISNVLFEIGEEEDLFGFERQGGLVFGIGARYKF